MSDDMLPQMGGSVNPVEELPIVPDPPKRGRPENRDPSTAGTIRAGELAWGPGNVLAGDPMRIDLTEPLLSHAAPILRRLSRSGRADVMEAIADVLDPVQGQAVGPPETVTAAAHLLRVLAPAERRR